jgi:tetratricopeptide (TPR) repeat protein
MKRWFWLLFVLVWAGYVLALPFESAVAKGNRFYHKTEYEKAEEIYKKANEIKKTALLKFNLSDALYKQGRFSESENIFSALTSEAQDVRLREQSFYNMGNAQFRQENYAGAVQAYEAALKIDPKDEDARYNLTLAKKMLKMPKKEREKQKQQQKKKEEQKKQDKEKDKTKSPAKETPKEQKLNREDAERILQGINGSEKHKAQKVKAGKGKDEKDW